MADDKSKRGSPDNKRLNKSEPYEMAYARKKAKASAGRSSGGAAKKASTRKASTASTARKASTRKAPASRSIPRKAAAPRRSGPALKTRGAPNPPKGEKTGPNTAPRTMKERDAVDLLVDDHLEVDARFKRYEKLADKTAAASQRQALAGEICAMLKAHTTIEEEIFYPAARRAGVDADLLDEADIEHASAKDLIAQIEAGDPDDDKYDAKVKVLGEYINHHVVEEHTELFPKCRRAGIDLVALRAEMAARKAELLPPGAAAAPVEAPGLISRLGDTLFNRA